MKATFQSASYLDLHLDQQFSNKNNVQMCTKTNCELVESEEGILTIGKSLIARDEKIKRNVREYLDKIFFLIKKRENKHIRKSKNTT